MRAKVLFKVANNFLLIDPGLKKQFKASIRKKTKLKFFPILIGDDVMYSKDQLGEYTIEKIVERKNFLVRPRLANIDIVLIVFSVKEPDYNSYLLNKFLAFYEARNINSTIIYFSKMDLLKNHEVQKINKIIGEYKKNGYSVFSSLDKDYLKKTIGKIINNKTICFVGQSGVGKSTLINYLIPNISLKTQAISEVLNHGKHTTTSSLIIPYKHGFITDTPGFSSLDLNLTKVELASSFNDFRTNNTNCKFKNCLHNNEKDCYIKKMVNEKKIDLQRYTDYLKMLEETK